MNQTQWNGELFFEDWVKTMKEGVRAVEEDHAEHLTRPVEKRADGYTQEALAEMVVMVVSVALNSAVSSGIDPQQLINAFDRVADRRKKQKEIAAMLAFLLNSSR